MKYVYIVETGVRYEGSVIEGIFSTLKGAVEFYDSIQLGSASHQYDDWASVYRVILDNPKSGRQLRFKDR